MSAALAFFSLFSMAPVVLIAVAMASFIFGERATQNQVIERIRSIAGNEPALALRAILAAPTGAPRISATVFGVVTLLLGATAVFGELRGSLNTIWGVSPQPSPGAWGVIKKRLLPFLMVLGVGLLLIVSLGARYEYIVIAKALGVRTSMPTILSSLLQVFFTFFSMTLLFAMIYKFLPNVRIMWSDVWTGAAVTSFLFMLGRWLIEIYLRSSLVRPVYGRAGSVIAFLIWIFLSAQIFFFGAEFTYVYAEEVGSRMPHEPKGESVPMSPPRDTSLISK